MIDTSSNFDPCRGCFLVKQTASVLPSSVAALRAERRTRVFKKGAVIFERGSRATSICCPSEGRVNSVELSPHGKSGVLFSYGSGEIFLIFAALKKLPLPCSFVAAERTSACFFSSDLLNQLLPLDIGLTRKLLEVTAFHEVKKQQRVASLLGKSAALRVGHALYLHRNSQNACLLTRREIADWTSLANETVIRALSQLEKQNFIKRHREGIQILSLIAFQKFLLG